MYIDIDVFKCFNFEIVVYYLKIDCLNSIKSKRIDIESILFLNKMFNTTEIKYWFIELELCDLIWIMRRVRHIIEIFIMIIIIYIDHAINIFIIKQITLNFINIDKFNLRLIRAFIYFFQFRLNIRHKSNKNYVIFNALSRFFFRQ